MEIVQTTNASYVNSAADRFGKATKIGPADLRERLRRRQTTEKNGHASTDHPRFLKQASGKVLRKKSLGQKNKPKKEISRFLLWEGCTKKKAFFSRGSFSPQKNWKHVLRIMF